MGEIRSALELALERTKDIKSDPEAVKAHEARNRGKRIVGKVQEDPAFDLKQALKKEDKRELKWVKEGIFSVVVSGITLPKSQSDLERFDGYAEVLSHIVGDRRAAGNLTAQIRQFLEQYLDDKNQLVGQLRQQFGPRIRQREEQMSQQLGTQVRLDPSNDPEFSKVLQSNMARLDEQYTNALAQAKDHLEQMFRSSLGR